MWPMRAAFMLVVAAGSLTDVPRLAHGATASQGTREAASMRCRRHGGMKMAAAPSSAAASRTGGDPAYLTWASALSKRSLPIMKVAWSWVAFALAASRFTALPAWITPTMPI